MTMPFLPNEADATYPDQAEPDSVDFDILLAGAGLTGVFSGCEVTQSGTPAQTVDIEAGVVRLGGKSITVSAQASKAVTAANGTNPRIDLVSINASGTAVVTAGTAAAEPVAPAIPATSVALAFLYVPANNNTHGDAQINDKRVMVPVATVFNVMDYGATGDGTDESTEIQSAVDAMEASGGGTVFYPPGYSFKGSVTMDANVPCRFSGYGAELIPVASSTAITIDSGNSNTAAGVLIEGVNINGDGIASDRGILISNTDRVRIRDVRIDDCVTGIELYTYSSGWVEGTYLQNVWIDGATTGFLFNPNSGTSFGETMFVDVGFNNCTTGMKINATANVYRSRFLGVTFWVNSSQTGWDIAGDVRGVTAQMGFEALGTPTSATGIWTAATATNLDRMIAQIEFTGSINSPVASAGPDLIWTEGPLWGMSSSGTQPAAWAQYADTWPRVRVDNEWAGGGGLSFGPGNAALDVNLYRSAADTLKTDDSLDVAGSIITTGNAQEYATAKTLDRTHGVVNMDATAASRAVTLPDNATYSGKSYMIRREGSNDVTITRAGSDTFSDAATTKTLGTDGAAIGIFSIGDGVWKIVGTQGTVT